MTLHTTFSRRSALRAAALAGVAGGFASVGARAAGVTVDVEAFRRPGVSDAAVLQVAFAELARRGGGVLSLDRGRRYDLGRVRTPGFAFHLKGLRDTRIEGNGATLECETYGSGKTQMFLVQNCHGLTFTNLTARDRGTNLRRDWQGMDFIHLEGSAGPSSRIVLDSVTVEDAVSLLTSSGTGPGRVDGITLNNVTAIGCYYAVNLQENGDNLRGNLVARNCRRAYFPYGVSGHDLTLDISHDGTTPGADACILIARKERDTSDITVRARFSGVLPWTNLVHLVQQPPVLDRGVIRDVSVNLFVDPASRDPNDAARLGLTAFLGQAALPVTSNRWENISLTGCFGRLRRDPVIFHTSAPAADIRVTRSC